MLNCIQEMLFFSLPFFFYSNVFYLYRLFKSHFGASVVIGSSQKSYLFHESQDMTFMLCGSIKTLKHLKVWNLVLSCLSWSFVIFIGRLKTILNLYLDIFSLAVPSVELHWRQRIPQSWTDKNVAPLRLIFGIYYVWRSWVSTWPGQES